MLNRIRLLAREKGKAVLLCTHILPDIQLISDFVVILARGRVQVAQSLIELSRPSEPSLMVRLLGAADSFMERLRKQGIEVAPQPNGTIALRGIPDALSEVAWKAARECGVGIRSMTPSLNSLEEIFLNAVRAESKDE